MKKISETLIEAMQKVHMRTCRLAIDATPEDKSHSWYLVDQAKAAFIELAESIDKNSERIQQALIDEQAGHYQCEQALIEACIRLETKDILGVKNARNR